MVRTIGRSTGIRCVRTASGAASRALCLLVTLGLCLVLAPVAAASPTPFTWVGLSSNLEGWSAAANWESDTAPTPSSEISSLTFPHLNSAECTVALPTDECYFSYNGVRGLKAESMTVDSGDEYIIFGEELTLGKGGLSISPASDTTGIGYAVIGMRLHLGATQTWRLANRSGAKVDEDEIALEGGGVMGSASTGLGIEIGNEAEPFLEEPIEVGPLTIAGAEPGKAGVFNGALYLDRADLNAVDQQPVSLNHIFMLGSGTVGPLTTDDGEITVGSGREPAEAIEATSATLGTGSRLNFQITGTGTTAREDYAQFVSHGAIELNNAAVEVIVRPPEVGKPCPILTPGETYTFVSTTGTLSGSFANAAESSPELPIRFAESCGARPSQTIRIGYHENGGTQTVTGTVEEAVIKQKQQEEAAQKSAQEAAMRSAEEAAAKKKHEEEAARGVLGAKEASPDATIAGTSLRASASGAVSLKISCPTGVSSCAGTVTLRTLGAVTASVAGAAKAKPAILTLASGSFAVAGGKVVTVMLHLSAKARRLLGRLHTLHVRVKIVAHDPTGGTHTGSVVATLRAPKAKPGKG